MLEVSVTKGGDEVAEKDIAEKTLEGYNDVFADIANVLLFNGRRLIKPDDLEIGHRILLIKWMGKFMVRNEMLQRRGETEPSVWHALEQKTRQEWIN